MGKAKSTETGYVKIAAVGEEPVTLPHFVSFDFEEAGEKAEFADSESGGKKHVTAGPGSSTGTIIFNSADGVQLLKAQRFYDVELHIDDSGENYREGTIYVENVAGLKATKADANTVLQRTARCQFDGDWTDYGTLSDEEEATTTGA